MCRINYTIEEIINHPKLSDKYKFDTIEGIIVEEFVSDWLDEQTELGISLEELGLTLDDLNDFYDLDESDYYDEAILFATGDKISIDYDDTLSTKKGFELAKRLIDEGYTVYIISARHDVEGMLKRADELGIPHSRVYATGSNKAKIEKVKSLKIVKHYDNNSDVVKSLGTLGYKFAKIVPLYRYYGKISDNSRRFCRSLVTRTNASLMRKQDIDALNSSNPGLGKGGSDYYSVFNWRGGANCKHKWVKYYYNSDTMNLVKSPEQPIQTEVNGKVPYANGTNTPPPRKNK